MTLLLTLLVFGLAFAGMGVGAIVAKRYLAGSCGGLGPGSAGCRCRGDGPRPKGCRRSEEEVVMLPSGGASTPGR